ncbi:aldehyde dehydrogenase family protein [Patescibacteria group bacterium]|nr:aldehyde dehydrogenase family protein [Patescibacteria group bacterium]MCL5091233.1 aldehyde dehydrogenase family protein [Patescibacteria group bacterium]
MKLQSINPHDQSVVGELTVAGQPEVKQTVKKARGALRSWRNLSVSARVKYIKKFRDLIVKNKEKIAQLTSLEMGKPLQQSRDDVIWELDFLDYYIKNGPEFLADKTVYQKGNEHFRITHEPYGVCVCIAPWNFPLSMADSGVIPALIAGNTVILKPSEYTSLTQKIVIDLLNATGMPDGVANLLVGDGRVGSRLIDDEVDLVWFTGSTKVGQEIYEKCGKKFLKALLEMGGSSPGVIFADADLNQTMDSLYWARFLNCGQVCTAIKRLFVERPVYEKVVKLFVDKLTTVKVGNPMDKGTDIGPLVSQKQLKLLKEQVADAVVKGARVEIGGGQPKDKALEKGNYFLPTILTKVKPNMRVLTEEVFGPVFPIVPFGTEEEAIALANRTEYGLSAEIYTTDVEKGERVARQIQAGTVAINTDNFFKPECPFGGFKKSGMGKEYGEIGMKEFVQTKLLAVVKRCF